MSTPLYKSLKSNGTTLYVFPGAAEDLSERDSNPNFALRFNHIALLNLPRQNTSLTPISPAYTGPDVDIMDPSTNLLSPASPTNPFSVSMVESLRNYVANQYEVLKNSRITNNSFYYNPNNLKNPTEVFFWKWLCKMNAMQLELADPVNDWLPLSEDLFIPNASQQVNQYQRTWLWRERVPVTFDLSISLNASLVVSGGYDYLEFVFPSSHRLRVGDNITITGVPTISNTETIYFGEDETNNGPIDHIVYEVVDDVTIRILLGTTPSGFNIANLVYSQGPSATLKYNRVVQYIGEISGVANVQMENENWTEITATVDEMQGKTPVVLFKVTEDDNYKPGIMFPFLSSEAQTEILGAESLNSPIRTSPSSYPGNYYGQFDILSSGDYYYKSETGDSIRKSGNYYGISSGTYLDEGDYDWSDIAFSSRFETVPVDGLNINFNKNNYVGMNPPGSAAIGTFDEWNATAINSQAPEDFEFNAILWFYEVEDLNTNEIETNLYGIEFLDNPENDTEITKDKFPALPKLVENGLQDGCGYVFSLNSRYGVVHDPIIPNFDPTTSHNQFSFTLFERCLREVAYLNNSFNRIISQFSVIEDEQLRLRQLFYTSQQMKSVISRMDDLDALLRLYSTLQIGDSDSIIATLDNSQSPPKVRLKSIDPVYGQISVYETLNLYDSLSATPISSSVTIPQGKNFLVCVKNNDNLNLSLSGNLELVLDKDLQYKQSVEFLIFPENGKFSKQLDLKINYDNGLGGSTSITKETLIGDLILPVDVSFIGTLPGPVSRWKTTPQWNLRPWELDVTYPTNPIFINTGGLDEVTLFFNQRTGLKVGDSILLQGMLIKWTDSLLVEHSYSLNGQFTIIDTSENIITSYPITEYWVKISVVDINNIVPDIIANPPTYPGDIVSFPNTGGYDFVDLIDDSPIVTILRGWKIKITRIDSSTTSSLAARYLIEKDFIR